MLKMFMKLEKQSNDPDVAAANATQLGKIMKKLEVKIPSTKKSPPMTQMLQLPLPFNWVRS